MNDATRHPLDLLPFLVNGTLSAAEREQVERHLAACAACREEAGFLRALKDGVRAAETAGPGELGWQRLQRALRQDGRSPRRRAPGWMKLALAASLGAVVLQTALLLDRSGDRVYRPAGEQTTGAVVQLRFRAQATEAQIRALLQAVGGRIVDGPGALGVYRVQLAVDPGDTGALRRRIESLRAQDAVVTHVAPD